MEKSLVYLRSAGISRFDRNVVGFTPDERYVMLADKARVPVFRKDTEGYDLA